jgi:hypothetical protein
LLVLPAILVGSVAGSAYAQPSDAADPPGVASEVDPAGVTLPWPTLGLSQGMDLYPDSSQRVTVQVPAGLTATRLQGLIHAPMNIGNGYLEINDGEGKFLAAVNLPPAGAAQAVTPFDVDISAAGRRPSSIDLSFTLRALDGADRVCGPTQRLTLSDLVTVFTGDQPPVNTIANFFPPVLEQVTIYAPTDADAAEQQAVLTLVSTLARIYSALKLNIAVADHPRGAVPPPASGLARAVVVETGPQGLTLERAGTPDSYLRVSGSGDALSTQMALLVNNLQPLAQAVTASVDKAGSDAALDGDTLTFSQLKVGGEASVIRTSSLQVGIDRTLLGPRSDGVKVHLLADYTPVQKDDAATVVIKAGGLAVYRATLDDTGLLDATFDLESQMLDEQWINMELALTYTPHQECGSLIAPITFQIDPRSTLTMHRGGNPLGGFAAFPSEFSPTFMVALDGGGPDKLAYAARVVAAIARLTRTELMPQIVDLKAAAEATSGALIVADSKAIKQTSLNPPVSGDGSAINFALPTELQVNIDQGLGSIQAFADTPRNRSVVLVTTTAEWRLVDPLFGYIDGSVGDWSQLTGDVLAAGAGGTPTEASIRPTGNIFEPPQSSASESWLKTGLVVGGVVVVGALAAIVVLAAILYSRRRRRTREAGTVQN